MNSAWIRGFFVMFMLFLLAACNQPVEPDASLELAAVSQSSDVCLWNTDCNAVGSSTLKRNASGATLNLHTSGLTHGDAVTVWAVIFNDPSACSDGCGEDDLPPFNVNANPDVMASVLRVAGHVIGASGQGNFGGRIKVGDTSEAFFGPGLVYAGSAEIHAVVRTHGPAIPGLVDEQLHTIGGGCNINGCTDLQFAVHTP